jgi:hypothetical protein
MAEENNPKRFKFAIANDDLLDYIAGHVNKLKTAAILASTAVASMYKTERNFKTVFADCYAAMRLRGVGPANAFLGVRNQNLFCFLIIIIFET